MTSRHRRLSTLLLTTLLLGAMVAPAGVLAAPPVAGDDVKTVAEDADAATIDVLANDLDDESDPTEITDATDPAHGAVVVAGGGQSLTYQPDADYHGPDTFDYTVTAGGETDTGRVDVTVTAVNDPPVAVDDPGVPCGPTINTGNSLAIPEDYYNAQMPDGEEAWFLLIEPCDLLANDEDVDNDLEDLTYEIVTQPAHGDAAFVEDRMVKYRPDPNYSTRPGDVTGGTWLSDSFTYRAFDGDDYSNVATMKIWLAPINDAPSFTRGADVTVAQDSDAYSAAWATAPSVGPAAESFQTLHYEVDFGPTSNTSLFSVLPAISNSGVLTFTPAPGQHGVSHIGVLARDDGGTTDWGLFPVFPAPIDHTSTVDLVITIDETPIVAVDDSFPWTEDGGQTTIDVLDNDTGPGPFVVTSVTHPANGTAAVAPGGVGVLYTPDPDANGTHTFDYTITGGSTATVTVTLAATNDVPVADDESLTVAEDAAATTVAVRVGDTDIDGDTLTITARTNGTKGAVAITGGGTTVVYKPNGNANGADSFTYTVSDGHGGTDIGTVNVTITPVNDAPTADNEAITVTEDATTATSVPALTGDADVDHDPLSIVSRTNGTKGTVTITGGGTGLTYKPLANKSGSDAFTYTISDGALTATGTVTVTITAVNDVPNAVNDLKTVAEGAGPIAVAVLANDQDIDGDTLRITARTNGAKGTVVITGGGTGLTYDPGPLKDGMDTFTYTVSDGHGGTDIATVLVTITPDRAAPALSGLTRSLPSQTLATNTANTVKVDLAWTGSDPGSGVVSYQLQVSVDGGTYTTITLPTATTRTIQRTLTIGRAYRFRVRATDGEGNVSSYANWTTITASRYQDNSSLAAYSGTWTPARHTSKSGGGSRYATSTAARVTFTFTGFDVAWVATLGTSAGRADVYIDGAKVATVDLDRSATAYRQMVLRRHFATLASHTLQLRPVGDGRVDVDAFIVLR